MHSICIHNYTTPRLPHNSHGLINDRRLINSKHLLGASTCCKHAEYASTTPNIQNHLKRRGMARKHTKNADARTMPCRSALTTQLLVVHTEYDHVSLLQKTSKLHSVNNYVLLTAAVGNTVRYMPKWRSREGVYRVWYCPQPQLITHLLHITARLAQRTCTQNE